MSAETRVNTVSSVPGPPAAPPSPSCELCGEPATVRVLVDYRQGMPLLRQFCLACADTPAARASALEPPPGERLGIPEILIVAGLCLGGLDAAGDVLGASGSSGFGVYQIAGVIVGAVMTLTGMIVRADLVVVMGALVFGLAVSADFFEFRGSAGFGWKQWVGIGFAVTMIATGFLLPPRDEGRKD